MQTSLDMEEPGFDKKSGAGLVNAVDALLTLASPSPLISGIYYDTSLVPGVDTIQLSVIGQYLTEGSQIYFNGESLGVNSVINGDTISGTILPFDDRYPAIQVYNPPNPRVPSGRTIHLWCDLSYKIPTKRNIIAVEVPWLNI